MSKRRPMRPRRKKASAVSVRTRAEGRRPTDAAREKSTGNTAALRKKTSKPVLAFFVPVRTWSPNITNKRGREHNARTAKEHRKTTALAFLSVRHSVAELPRKPVVRLTRSRVAWAEMDDDNLRASLKAVRDEVSVALGFLDDNDPAISFEYGQTEHHEHGVFVDVFEGGP